MTPEQQQQMRAQAVQQELDRRGLTINGAAQRLDMSRETITKLVKGRKVQLQVIERFAREFKLNVNDFRQMWGYEPIMEPKDDKPLAERFRDLADEFPDERYAEEIENAVESYSQGVLAQGGIPNGDRQRLLRVMREILAEERARQGRESAPEETPDVLLEDDPEK